MSSHPPLVACWLDQSIGETGTNLQLKARFEGISRRITKWYYFDSGEKFTQFMDENPNIKLIVIMSGHLAKTLVTSVSDRQSLHSVYIFCGNTTKYQSLLSDENKVKAVFNNDDALYHRMQVDLQREFP